MYLSTRFRVVSLPASASRLSPAPPSLHSPCSSPSSWLHPPRPAPPRPAPQDPSNLKSIVGNERLTGALSRVLAEERRKSTALVSNILEIFYCFSSISQLHPILVQNRIGQVTLNVIELELRRYQLKAREAGPGAGPGFGPASEAGVDGAEPGLDSEELVAILQQQEKLLFVCFYLLLNLAEDPSIEYRMKQRNIIRYVRLDGFQPIHLAVLVHLPLAPRLWLGRPVALIAPLRSHPRSWR